MRKNFFNDAKDGYFKREKRETAAKNPMTGIKSMITLSSLSDVVSSNHDQGKVYNIMW